MARVSPTLPLLLLLVSSCVSGALRADDAKPSPPRGEAPALDPRFESEADAASFRRALAKVFGASATLTIPESSLSNAADAFGISVAVSGDTALVGAYRADTLFGADAGTVYVFVRSAGQWMYQTQLLPGDGAPADQFGSSVAIDGDIAVVGVRGYDPDGVIDAGAAYAFTRMGGGWTQGVQMTADELHAGARLGTSVAVSGTTALIGAPNAAADLLTLNTGAAYVFVRGVKLGWNQQQVLLAPSPQPGDAFGSSVALSGNTALAGAPNDDVAGVTSNSGSASVFTRDGLVWSLEQTLVATNAQNDDAFGFSVALSGDTALVGVSFDDTAAGNDAGSGYVFTRSAGTWSQQAQLFASDAAASDNLGVAAALSGDVAVLGAWQAGPADAGAAYVFTRNGTSWTQQPRLLSRDGASDENFGTAVAVDGGIVLVSAPEDTALDESYFGGSVDVFIDAVLLNGGGLVEPVESLVANGDAGDLAGTSVATTDDTFVVGAPDAGAGGTGEVYVFKRGSSGSPTVAASLAKVVALRGPAWSKGTAPVATLTDAGGSLGDKFGTSVAIAPDGETIVVGAPLSDTSGDVFIYRRPGADWTSSSSGSELVPTVTGATLEGYGTAVAIDDTGVVAVGAPLSTAGAVDGAGAVYVFQDNGTTATQTEQLLPPSGAGAAGFGSAVAVSDDVLAIGAPDEDGGGQTDAGAAYVYTDSGTSRVTTGALGDKFGTSVATLDGTVVVGAPGQDTTAGIDSGAATVYQPGGAGYVATSTLVPLDGTASQSGTAVATNGEYIVVGAPLSPTSTRPASIYFYDVPEGSYPAIYSPTATLTGSDEQAEDGFGSAVAISPRSLLLGLPLDDVDGGGEDQGSAERYIFDRIHRSGFE